jgi:acetyltransferase EpsM
MAAEEFVLFGDGGHAKVVESIIRSRSGCVLHRLGKGAETPSSTARFIIAIGDNRKRAEIAGANRGLHWGIVIASNAVDAGGLTLGEGTQVLYNAVIEPDARIGRHVIVNSSATVAHDCIVGDFAHVGPGARLCGGVELGEGVLVGAGAAVAPNVHIGDWAVIGLGAAVVADIPAGAVAYGVPARVRS